LPLDRRLRRAKARRIADSRRAHQPEPDCVRSVSPPRVDVEGAESGERTSAARAVDREKR
jgi:hypothetical protein